MKTKIIKFLIYFFSIPAFIVLSFIAGMATYGIIVRDPCQYHGVDDKDISWLFKLFYPMTGRSGYHPEPGWFNFIFFLSLGAVLGFFVARLIISRVWRKKRDIKRIL